jgi:hypothetical protein
MVQGKLSLTPLLLRNREGPVKDFLAFLCQRKLAKVVYQGTYVDFSSSPQKHSDMFIGFVLYMIGGEDEQDG